MIEPNGPALDALNGLSVGEVPKLRSTWACLTSQVVSSRPELVGQLC